MTRMAALMAADPAVARLTASVFGRSGPVTVEKVLSTPTHVLVAKGTMLSKPKNVLRLAKPKPPVPVKPVAPPTPPAPPAPASAQAPDLKPKPVPVLKADDDDVDFAFTTEIVKADEEQQNVFGWASVVTIDGEPVQDRQGDSIDIVELTKSAYDYVVNSRTGGHQHKRTEQGAPVRVSDMIESMVFTPEKIEKMGLPSDFPHGWWVGYHFEDPQVWKDYKEGKLTGFSVHGRGRRIPVGT